MQEERKFVVQGVFLAVGLIFLLRLFYLQVIDDSYKYAADNNVIKKVIEYPHRGQVFDRNGKLVVINGPVFDISFVPKKTKIQDTAKFCRDMGITRGYFDTLVAAYRKDWREGRAGPMKPYTLFKQVSTVDFARIQDRLIDYPGFSYTSRTIRSYPHQSFANALGYIGEIGKKQLETQEEPYYQQGDYIGVSGIEKYYEKELRGQRGVQFVLENVKGVVKGSFKNGEYDTLSVPGQTLVSSIDLELQKYAEWLMANKVGSIVAIDPNTGEILCMVSTPSYDPNRLTGRDLMKNFVPLSKDPLIPLYNRPIQAVYRPGSIFKLVQSLVGLQQGSITPAERLPDVGPMGCHHHSGMHNGLHNAIQYSCNVYFYQAFRQYIYHKETGNTYKDSQKGLMRWRDAITKFGFGRKLGVDLPNEKRGFVPDTSFFDRVYGRGSWKFSNWYSMAIGEGELGVVPLQMANLAAIIANRGHYYTPHLVKSIGKDGKPAPQFTTPNYVGVDSSHFSTVIDGMEDVVKAGTARLAIMKDYIVCGKTGTSENKKGKDHSVFIAFAPKHNPKIAIACYVENAGFGGVVAAPIASLIMEKYISPGVPQRPQLEKFEKYMHEQNFMPKREAPEEEKDDKKADDKKAKEGDKQPEDKTRKDNQSPDNKEKVDSTRRPVEAEPLVRRVRNDKTR
ncbi:MAG: Peptidoglycan D,D-transpeptidase MrdA [uncultured Cytophagales bacterium]|uniref:Peptidoglycan D,D-transpeptidase MrdA n=1 Tax=uncultured Cytophagales bacterium TaxID=158755 RepID=A0A6J4IMR3_9SPHI|nr:MAG: Peptidoglycan D,D-transpeptidase MrdA [uncultured Cytophagales bacterium]